MIPIVQSLRHRRKMLGLSQEKLADRVGIHRVQLTSIEAGKNNARMATVEKIAQALGAELMVIPRTHISAVLALIGEKPAADDRQAGSTFDDVFIPDPSEE